MPQEKAFYNTSKVLKQVGQKFNLFKNIFTQDRTLLDYGQPHLDAPWAIDGPPFFLFFCIKESMAHQTEGPL